MISAKYKKNYQCKIYNYLIIQSRNFMIHQPLLAKARRKKYFKYCNKAFFCDLFYNKHIESPKHKLFLRRHKLIQNNKFNDIDKLIIEPYYMQYINDIEKQIKQSVKIINNYLYSINNTI